MSILLLYLLEQSLADLVKGKKTRNYLPFLKLKYDGKHLFQSTFYYLETLV